MIRAVTCALALLACKARVIELGTPDAHVDADLASCACRLRCTTASSTVDCFQLGSGATCGSDQFCTGALGICTATTPAPCAGSASMSVCTSGDTSSALCNQ